LLAACVLASAGEQPATLFTHAFASRGCTQEDAPALEIYLTQSPSSAPREPQRPYIRFEISAGSGDVIARGTYTLSRLRRDPGSAGRIVRAELSEVGAQPIWLSGSLTLDRAAPAKQTAGRYDLTAPDGRQFRGDFSAEYSNAPATCG